MSFSCAPENDGRVIDVPEASSDTWPPYCPDTSCRPAPPRAATTAATASPSDEIEADRTSRLVPRSPPDGVVPVSVTLSSAPSRTMLRPTSVLGVESGSNDFNNQAYTELRDDSHPIVLISGGDVVDILRSVGLNDISAVQRWLDAEF